MRLLFGSNCSSDDVPVMKKVNDGISLSLVSCDMMLAGNDTVISPVTLTMHLQEVPQQSHQIEI